MVEVAMFGRADIDYRIFPLILKCVLSKENKNYCKSLATPLLGSEK